MRKTCCGYALKEHLLHTGSKKQNCNRGIIFAVCIGLFFIYESEYIFACNEFIYRIYPKYCDRQAWANCVDPDYKLHC